MLQGLSAKLAIGMREYRRALTHFLALTHRWWLDQESASDAANGEPDLNVNESLVGAGFRVLRYYGPAEYS